MGAELDAKRTKKIPAVRHGYSILHNIFAALFECAQRREIGTQTHPEEGAVGQNSSQLSNQEVEALGNTISGTCLPGVDKL